MKKTIALLLFFITVKIQAQQLTGLWYSADSSRIYEIKSNGFNNFEAIIKASTRKNDLIGYTAIKNLQYNLRKKRYEGYMYSVSDNKPCFVKIKFNNKKDNRLLLKLNRLFIMDVSLNWTRAVITNSSSAAL